MFKKIAIFLIVFLSFISMFFVFLSNGIRIDSFSFFNLNISKLYIKLDKKLIVEIDEITLSTKSSVKSTQEDIKNIIEMVPTVLSYFQKIDIESLQIKDNKFKILFDNNFIYLDNKHINISSKYKVAGSSIELDLYSIYIKQKAAMFRGKLKLDYHKEVLNFFGKFNYKDARGDINLQINKDFIDFFVSSEKIKNIKFLKSLFRVPKVGEQWMYDNVTGEMKLNYLYGKLHTDTLEPVLNEIKGDALIKNAEITFNKKLAPVKTKELHIVFEKGILNFIMQKPKYKNIDIDGSSVKIPKLVYKEGIVKIKIKAKHVLDDDVLEILKAYKINLPLKQISGKTDAIVSLDVPYNGDIKTNGVFKIRDSTILLNEFPIYTKETEVLLKGTHVLINSPSVKYKEMINTALQLDIDIKTLKANGEVNIKSFLINSSKNLKDVNSEIINIKDFKSSLEIDFSKNTKLKLKELNTSVSIDKDFTSVKVDKFESIYKYSKLLQSLEIKKGKLKVDIKDENEIYLQSEVFDLNLPLKKDEKAITSLFLKGDIKNDITTLKSKDDDIIIVSSNNKVKIKLKDLDIYYKKEENNSLLKELDLDLENVNINIQDDTFYSKKSNILIKNSVLNIDGVFYKDDLPFFKNTKRIKEFDVIGIYKDSVLNMYTKDKTIKFLLNDEKINLDLNNIDLAYNTKGESKSLLDISIKADNSNIFVNDKYKVLSSSYVLNKDKDTTSFKLIHNNTKLDFLQTKEQIKIDASNISDVMLNTFFDKDLVKGGLINLSANSDYGILKGKVLFNQNRIKNLAILNNLILLVNTTPALINPLLAIPAVFGMVSNGGFNLNGYAINEGSVDFIYNLDNQFLNMHKIETIGNSVDFKGNATVDLNTDLIDSNMELIFMKDYSSIVSYIPIVNYIFLGKDRVVSTNIKITGTLDDPIINSKIVEDSVAAPVNLIKRIITAPFEAFSSPEEDSNSKNKSIKSESEKDIKKESVEENK